MFHADTQTLIKQINRIKWYIHKKLLFIHICGRRNHYMLLWTGMYKLRISTSFKNLRTRFFAKLLVFETMPRNPLHPLILYTATAPHAQIHTFFLLPLPTFSLEQNLEIISFFQVIFDTLCSCKPQVVQRVLQLFLGVDLIWQQSTLPLYAGTQLGWEEKKLTSSAIFWDHTT